MNLVPQGLMRLPIDASISRQNVAAFMSGLVPGQSISAASIYRISKTIGFKDQSIPIHQVGHFYLLIFLRNLWFYHSYQKLSEKTGIDSDLLGDSRDIDKYWSQVVSAGGFSKVDLNNKLMNVYSTQFIK